MKENVLKGCIYAAALATVMVGFPLFFRANPDLRFFWNLCAVLAMGIQIFLMIAGGRATQRHRLKMILIVLLSVIMSNEYYRYEMLSSAIPLLNRLSESSLFGLGGLVIFFFAIGGGIYHTYHVKKENRNMAGREPAQQDAADATAVTCDSLMKQGQAVSSVPECSAGVLQPAAKEVLPLRHIVGIGAAITGIVAASAVIFFALCKNQDFLLQLTNQRLPLLAFNLLIGFGIILASVFVVTILVFYFIQMCCSIIREMLQHQRLDIQNDSLLKCISVFLTLLSFFFYRNSTMKDLFILANGSNDVLSLLMVVIMFTVLAFVTLMIYKMLQSFARPDGILRGYTNKIFSLTITTLGDTVINLLEIVSKAPEILNALTDTAKRAFHALGNMLFSMDEEDFEDFNHL